MNLTSKDNWAESKVKNNFKSLSEQNQIELEQRTNLSRAELIYVYTLFLSMFVVQEVDSALQMSNRN